MVTTSGIAALLYALLPLDRFGGWVAVLVVVVLIASLVPLAAARARRIIGSTRPALDAAEALITLLTLLVLGFATVYYVLSLRAPGQLSGIETKLDSVYYTVSILSTVGFGDVSADGQVARLAATVQMLFDLVFVALAVRLLGWAYRQRAEQNPRDRDAPPAR